ncbi:uncharacterized protein LOC110678721 [Aedes aegypti]|uniref:Odorant receptor n=2 Tax=Aedes aegypti TaxID=7159 RepID=A0A6R8GKW9_AEDAE
MEQLEFRNTVRRTVQIIFGFIVVDTVLLVIPNSMKNDLLGLPHALTLMGRGTSEMLNFILASFLSVSSSPKYFSSTACVGVTLVGMRTKLRIISHRFKLISQQTFSSEEQCFKRINGEVKEALAQHLEYWSHLQTMKDLIGKMFFLVHYFSIFAVGALLYVCHEITPNSITLVIIAGTSSVLLEYFLLCCFVESLADEADAIEQYIFEISAQIPFCSNLRSEYVQLQSTLMIIWINTRNGMSMNCVGLFEINISAFAALVDVAYSVLMFLINMG